MYSKREIENSCIIKTFIWNKKLYNETKDKLFIIKINIYYYFKQRILYKCSKLGLLINDQFADDQEEDVESLELDNNIKLEVCEEVFGSKNFK